MAQDCWRYLPLRRTISRMSLRLACTWCAKATTRSIPTSWTLGHPRRVMRKSSPAFRRRTWPSKNNKSRALLTEVRTTRRKKNRSIFSALIGLFIVQKRKRSQHLSGETVSIFQESVPQQKLPFSVSVSSSLSIARILAVVPVSRAIRSL